MQQKIDATASRQRVVVIVGGGPAGLRAAEVAAAAGAQVQLYEAQRAVGRKFLVAGRGGLNLTHSEPAENFPARYRTEPERWRNLLADFGPDQFGRGRKSWRSKPMSGRAAAFFREGRRPRRCCARGCGGCRNSGCSCAPARAGLA